MNKPFRSAFLAFVILAISLSCGVASTSVPPTSIPSPIPPTFTPSATPTITFTPTPAFTPTPSCSVQNGKWLGKIANFVVNNCTISNASFSIFTGSSLLNVSLNNSIPIMNNGVQYTFTTVNTGLQSSSTTMEFSGTFISSTEFKGQLKLPEGPVKIQLSLQK